VMPPTFVCFFKHARTGERCEVVVSLDELDEHDHAAIEWHRHYEGAESADFVAGACALRIAYQRVEKGFMHDREPERRWIQ
jgi:hypothetical protein